MRNYYYLVFFIVLSSNLLSQTVIFQKTYGLVGSFDEAKYIRQTNDSGYIMVGSDSYDIGLVKTKLNGDTLWSRIYGGIFYDNGNAVRQTYDGGYVVVGSTSSFGQGNGDVYLLKINSSGDTVWTKTIGGLQSDEGFDVCQTRDSGFIITGITNSFGAGNWDIYLIKTDLSGNIAWAKTFGGNGDDKGYCVKELPGGNFVLAGVSNSFGNGSSDTYLLKIDPAGNLLWSKTYSNNGSTQGMSVEKTFDSGFIISGQAFLLKTDSMGNVLWSKGYPIYYLSCAQQTSDSGFVMCGTTIGACAVYSAVLIKTNSIGNMIWSRFYALGPTESWGRYVVQTFDKGFAIVGSADPGSSVDFWFIKTDSLGNSGCNQCSINFSANTINFVAAVPSTQTSSGGIEGGTNTSIAKGCILTTACYTGAEELPLDNMEVIVYPNPFVSTATLEIKNQDRTYKSISFELFDMFGRKVQSRIINNNLLEVQRENLPSGIYLYRLSAEGAILSSNKIILQ